MIFFMLTNIINESTEVLFLGNGAEELLAEAFDADVEGGSVILPGVVSRKKQFIPPIFESISDR